MSKIKPCARCGSFAVQSLDHATGNFVVGCFNEFSTETYNCNAIIGPYCKTPEESIDGWNAMQSPLSTSPETSDVRP